MTRTTLAVAADYADAMLVARRAKSALFLVLILVLVGQIGIFFAERFTAGGTVTVSAGTTTQPTMHATTDLHAALQYLINATDFLGVTLTIALAIVLLLIVMIMLVGRLIGVSHVTGAFVWCVLLLVFLFPWQSLWDYPRAGVLPSSADTSTLGPRFGIPGILYTWPELEHKCHFPNFGSGEPWTEAALGWARFVVWPAVAVLILMSIQVRSARGLKFALGEAEMQVEVTPTTPPVT